VARSAALRRQGRRGWCADPSGVWASATGALLGLSGSQNPFSGTRTYQTIAHLPLTERVARMRDPEIRKKILSEDPKEFNKFPLFHRLRWDLMSGSATLRSTRRKKRTVSPRSPRAKGARRRSDIRRPSGKRWHRLHLYDHLQLCVRRSVHGRNVAAQPQLHHGTGDGGAHVAFILDAGFQTWMLNHWGRTLNKFTPEELIRRLTSDPPAPPAFTIAASCAPA